MTDHLAIYLNDHLAGATAGLELARRARDSNEGSELGRLLTELADEIAADRETLRRLMRALSVSESRVKVAAGWSAEKLGRLKPNGQLRGYSPLSRLVELEGLSLGIAGKKALWESLAAALPERPPDVDFEQLATRAESQRTRLERFRPAVAAEALAGATAAAEP
jgi:hypothetical protein